MPDLGVIWLPLEGSTWRSTTEVPVGDLAQLSRKVEFVDAHLRSAPRFFQAKIYSKLGLADSSLWNYCNVRIPCDREPHDSLGGFGVRP